jgi:hypothetical protein
MQMTNWIRAAMLVAGFQTAAALDMKPSNGSVLSLLLETPFYGHFAVAEVRQSRCNTVVVRDDGTSISFATQAPMPGEAEFLAKVTIGRRYAFPQCFFDLMTAEDIGACVHHLPGKMFEEIMDVPPFRATVLQRVMDGQSYSIILREPGGRLHHLSGLMGVRGGLNALGGRSGEDFSRITAWLLKKDASFEFPAILHDAGLADQVRLAKREPKSRMDEVLRRYIGEWKGRTAAISYATLRMRCHWQADGQGIWREITYEHGPDVTPPPADVARMAYSEASKCYLSWNPAKDALKFRIHWYEPTKTFTTVLPPDEEGVERYNTATFVDDDHIEWKTFSKLADGRVLEMNSGSYERVSHDAEVPLPEESEPSFIDDLSRKIYGFAAKIQALENAVPMGQRMVWNTPPYQPDPNRPDMPTFDKPSDKPVIEVVDATLAGLEASLPFRAKIVSKSIQPHNITLKLQHSGGNLQTIEAADFKLAEKPVALALAKLKEGEVHEFPHCLSSKPSNTALSPAMSRLQPFIGSWSKTIRCRDGSQEAMPCVIRYFSSADGSAIWCETDMGGRQRLERIVTGEKEGVYLIAPEHAAPGFQAMQGRWDEANRVLTLVRSFVNAPPGAVTEESTFHLDSADQITWRCRLIAADESLVRESSGTLSRLKP